MDEELENELFIEISGLVSHVSNALAIDSTTKLEVMQIYKDVLLEETGYVQNAESDEFLEFESEGSTIVISSESIDIEGLESDELENVILDFMRARQRFSMNYWNNEEYMRNFNKVNGDVNEWC